MKTEAQDLTKLRKKVIEDLTAPRPTVKTDGLPEEFKDDQSHDREAAFEQSGFANTLMKKITVAHDKIAAIVSTAKKPRKDL